MIQLNKALTQPTNLPEGELFSNDLIEGGSGEQFVSLGGSWNLSHPMREGTAVGRIVAFQESRRMHSPPVHERRGERFSLAHRTRRAVAPSQRVGRGGGCLYKNTA
jgi:hypothetical protein